MWPVALAFSYFFASVLFALIGLQSIPRNRPLFFILHAFFGALSFRRITDVTSSFAHGSMMGMFFTVWMSHMSYILCLEGSQHHAPGAEWNWHRAYKMCWNVRWVKTAHEAPSNIGKPFSSPAVSEGERLLQKSTTPSKEASKNRRMFLLKQLASIAIIYGINMLYEHALQTFYPLEFSDFSPTRQSYLRRLGTISARENAIRTILVLNFVWSSWGLLTCYHKAWSIFFVGVGLDEPEDWPALWGSPFEMYSVRRFWGKFWHRSAFRAYIGYGNLIAEKALRLRRGTLAHRICAEFTVFFVSGVMHAMTTRMLGFRGGYWEDVAWFCMNFAAILVETAVQAVWKGVFGRAGASVGKVGGAVWLFAFFFWSLPKTQSPKVFNGMVQA